MAEAAAETTQFNKQKSIGINLGEKATFTFIPTLGSAAIPTQGAKESLLSLCTQTMLHRSSAVFVSEYAAVTHSAS